MKIYYIDFFFISFERKRIGQCKVRVKREIICAPSDHKVTTCRAAVTDELTSDIIPSP